MLAEEQSRLDARIDSFSQRSVNEWSNLSTVERGSSVVECRIRDQVSPGSNPPLLPIPRLGIFVLSMMPQLTQLYK